MPTLLWVVLGIFYIVVIFIDLDTETTTNTKYHDGGFLNMGYTTSSNRDANTKDVWWAIIWLPRLVLFFIAILLGTINDVLVVVLLLVGFKYKETEMYYKLNKLFWY